MRSFSPSNKLLPLKINPWYGPADPFTFDVKQWSLSYNLTSTKCYIYIGNIYLLLLYNLPSLIILYMKRWNYLPGVRHQCWQGEHHCPLWLPEVHFQQHLQRFCCSQFLACWNTVGRQFSLAPELVLMMKHNMISLL